MISQVAYLYYKKQQEARIITSCGR